MPSKKKKYNARFPAGRIKKIMQSDEEIGKVAQAVPVIISRTLELFVESLLTKTLKITNSRNAKTLSTSHMKQCIMSEQRFDFLRELVKNVPDISVAEEAANYMDDDDQSSPGDVYPDSDTPYDLSMPSTSSGRSNNRSTPVANGVQTLYQYKQQNKPPPHNGSGHYAGSTETDLSQRLRHRFGGNTSVIMHTASVTQSQATTAQAVAARDPYENYVQPLKLLRSESSPANATQHMWHVAHNVSLPQQQQLHQAHKRLRHQSQSVPCSSSNNNSCISLQKSEHTIRKPQLQTAIPAPVFSYDLCNKPVVKIDYSNLPLTSADTDTNEQHSTATGQLPLSAPVTSAGFDFSAAAPIINIDLSNIVANSTDANTAPGNNVPTPAVATISIGALPVNLAKVAPTSLIPTCNTSNNVRVTKASSTSIALPPNQTTDSKMGSIPILDNTSSSSSSPSALNSQHDENKTILKASSAIMATMTAPKMNTMFKQSSSYFELDEDYDNV